MLSVSFYSILGVCLFAIALGLVTLVNNPRQQTNRIFSSLSSLSGIYALANYLADHDQTRGLFWVRSTFVLGALLVMFMLLFLGGFPRKLLSQRTSILIIASSVFIAVISCFKSFIPSVILHPQKTEVVTGSLYIVFIIFLVFGLFGMVALILYQLRQSTNLERERVKYVAIGLVVTALLLATTNLFLPLLQGNNNLADLGSYFILIFISFTTFAIIRHRLFNIRRVVARSVAYTLLLATLAVFYIAAGFALTNIFSPTDAASKTQLVLNTVLALILAFTFQPLRRFFERVTDRIFYRDRYDSQAVLNNFSKILVSELNLDRILKRALAELCESVHIQFGQLIIFNHDRVYRVEHYGPLPQRLMVAPELTRLGHAMLVADELDGGERKSLMDRHGIRVTLSLRTREEFVGYLLLGDKLSGDIYSSQDLKLLEIIGKELAVAILNAKAYAEIQEFNLTLQARVEHATNRLRVANRHLKELDRAKDEFISMASHQLRTPLTTIKGYLSMMLEGDAGKLTSAQKEFVNYAFGSSERMVNLISDLLNVSRLSAGRFLIQTKPTDMVQMIDDEVRQLSQHASAKGIKLIFERPLRPLPPAQIDDNKTRQVVMNFIDNAIYYTQAGEVRVVLGQTGDRVRFEVHDTGIGVPEDARKKLFTKFYRAGNAQVLRPDGTGLGLYLAKRVVQDQGGTIIFSSVEGKGSTFGFELPFNAQPVSRKDAHAKPRAHAR
jgi:signal transduction histidine kinase